MALLAISGKNFDVPVEVRDYVGRKVDKLSRHLRNLWDTRVEITEEFTRSPMQRYVVQVTVNTLDTKGTILRGEERDKDILVAIDRTLDVMNTQIERYKGKRYARRRGVSFARGILPEKLEKEMTPQMPSVIKVKRFTITPMEVDQAVEQMELLGHDFFIFFNTEEEALNVLYRRKDGNYGLIQPELA